MASPQVSVIIPVYNQGNYIAAALQSVLDQTFSDFEVIVVNDASTDHTDVVIRQFTDPRIKYIVHKENRYASAARNTGIYASSGELISLFDGDDLMHPEKLQIQVDFLKENPTIGLTYNSRFEIDQSGLPLTIVRSPLVVTLADLVLDYPYAPSEVIMRKEWALRVGLFDESFVFHGEDPDFFMRLALQGCKMAGVDRVLNYRRLHAGRTFRNLAGVIEGEIRAFENTFADPRCPSEVLALREKSLGKIQMILSYWAFAQTETVIGHDLIRKAVRFDPSNFDEKCKGFLEFLVRSSVRDGGDHEAVLRRIFAQLPPELAWVIQHVESAVAYGYLLRGTREVMWGRTVQGVEKISQATAMGVQPGQQFCRSLVAQLLIYAAVFGNEAAQTALQDMSTYLSNTVSRRDVRWLKGCYSVNQAFEEYRQGQYFQVISRALQATIYDPTYLTNRGVVAIFLRSLFNLLEVDLQSRFRSSTLSQKL